MDRDQLKAWLEEGLSLPQIGALVGRDPSTVGYWVQKHGLVANGNVKYAPRGGLSRDQLEELVEHGATQREIAELLDRSVATIRYWLSRYGLKTDGHRRHRHVFRQADKAGLTRVPAECSRHGAVEFVKRGDGGWRCLKCRAEDVVNWRRRVKAKLLTEAGGRCQLCGYARYQGALQFHHLDPSRKEFAISRRGVTRAFEEVRAEAAKCVLLCSNCHAEVEAGVASVDALVQTPEAA
jgi:DNA-binding CsgD family transcriptional regulator